MEIISLLNELAVTFSKKEVPDISDLRKLFNELKLDELASNVANQMGLGTSVQLILPKNWFISQLPFAHMFSDEDIELIYGNRNSPLGSYHPEFYNKGELPNPCVIDIPEFVIQDGFEVFLYVLTHELSHFICQYILGEQLSEKHIDCIPILYGYGDVTSREGKKITWAGYLSRDEFATALNWYKCL